MADKIAKRGVSIYIDGKEVANSVKAISGEMKKLTNEQAKMTMGADNYVAHGKKIEYLKSLLVEHKDYQKQIAKEYSNMEKASDKYSKTTESGFSKAANGFNKYFAIFTAGLAAVTGLTLGLNKFMDMRNELEQSSANLKAITGLDDKSVAWMRQYAKELSTTTTEAGVRITATSKEIMDGFTVIGSKRPELLKNKEAMADVTKQALTLAATGVPVETAFEVVTASMNQFNLTGKDANRIINSIASGSLEGSAEADSLAGSLKNVGTVANDSNMTMEDTVAMLEVLASKQLVGEEAGTKLRGALLKLKEAGVGYASGQFNVRDAIVEVNKQMDKKAGALQRDALLQKIFGAENVTAGTILLQNVDAYDKLRVAVTGTDVAMRQAQIQTSTITAQMAQAQNRFNELGMELVKNLNPAMLKATNFGTNFMKLLMQLPMFLKENKVGIIAFVAGLMAYLTVINLSNMATKAKLALAVLEKVADYVKIMALRTRIALTGEATIAELRLVAAQNALNASMMKNIWGLVAAAIAIAIVYFADFLAKTKEVTEAQKIANSVMDDYRSAFVENSKSIIQERSNLTALVTAIINTNDNQSTRNRLIDELNTKYPGFISFIDKEKVSNELLTAALANVNEQYDMKLKSVAMNSKSQAYENAIVKSMQRQLEIQDKLAQLRNSPGDHDKEIKALEAEDTLLSSNIKKYETAASTFRANASANDQQIKDMNTSGYYENQMEQWKTVLKDVSKKRKDALEEGKADQASFYNQQIVEANAAFKYAQLKYIETKKLEKSNKPTSDTPTNSVGNSTPDTTADQKKQLDLITKTIDNAHADRLTKLKESKVKEKKTEVEFNSEVMTEDKAYYDLKIKALEGFKKRVNDKNFLADINKQINELKDSKAELDIKFQEKINKILLDANPVKKENTEYDDRLRELGIFNKKREDMTADELAVLDLLEKQHQDNLFKIKEQANKLSLKQSEDKFDEEYKSTKDLYDQQIDLLSRKAELSKNSETSFSEFSGIETDPEILLSRKRIEAIKSEILAKKRAGLETTDLNKQLLSSENKLTDEYVQKYQQRAQLFGRFGEELGSVIGNMATGNKDALKSALVSMIDLGLDYLKAQAEMAIAGATVQSLAMPDSILTFGASGVARAAVLVGLIEAAFGAAKTIIGSSMGYYDGGYHKAEGYTGGNDPRQVRGTFPDGAEYHGLEFIANHRLTQNPEMRPVLDLWDTAQKLGTASSLTRNDISRALRLSPSGYTDMSSSKTERRNNTSSGSGEDNSIMLEMISAINRLNDHLDNGIEAPVHISGDKGIYEQLKRYTTLINNAKG